MNISKGQKTSLPFIGFLWFWWGFFEGVRNKQHFYRVEITHIIISVYCSQDKEKYIQTNRTGKFFIKKPDFYLTFFSRRADFVSKI